MNVNSTLALVGLALAGASMAAGATLPTDVPWYFHTVIAAVQGGAAAVLLVVNPTALSLLRPTPIVTVVPAPPAA